VTLLVFSAHAQAATKTVSVRKVTILLTCSARANQVAFVALRGNDGAACDGPPDKGCEAGPLCDPFPRESVCFGGFSAFDARTTYTFGPTWSRDVPCSTVSRSSLDATCRSTPPSSVSHSSPGTDRRSV